MGSHLLETVLHDQRFILSVPEVAMPALAGDKVSRTGDALDLDHLQAVPEFLFQRAA